MEKFSRIKIHKSAEIAASAAALWELITDWAGIERWWLTEAQGGRPGPGLVSCELIGSPGEIPRTRRITMDNGGVTSETLLHQNDLSRCLYYDMNANAYVQSYLATIYVDEIDEHSCLVNVSSRFDVVPTIADAGSVAALYETVYEKALFNGYHGYFARHRTALQTAAAGAGGPANSQAMR